MKKLIVMAAMLALMLVATAPAFAASATGGNIDRVDSDQIQASLTIQRNSGNDQDLAGVAQDLSVDQNQVLAAEDSTAAGGDANLSGF
jgi:hypothetical protein